MLGKLSIYDKINLVPRPSQQLYMYMTFYAMCGAIV